jgi:hypothetical protein
VGDGGVLTTDKQLPDNFLFGSNSRSKMQPGERGWSILRKIAIGLCALLLVVTLILLPVSFFFKAYDYRLSLGEQFHVGLLVYGVPNQAGILLPDPRLVFFSDAEYGPYQGSIFGLHDRYIGFGDTWGIYFRHFSGVTGGSYWSFWTLSLSIWYPILLLSFLSFVAAFPQKFKNFSLKSLLLLAMFISVVFGFAKTSGAEHPATIALVLGIYYLARMIYRQFYKRLVAVNQTS